MTRGGIRQQLTLGLAALALLLAALLSSVLYLGAESLRAERRFTEEIEPARQRAVELERAILYVGLGLRSYLLHADESRLERFHGARAQAQGALRRFGESRDEQQRLLRQRLTDYLTEVTAAVRRRAKAPLAMEEEVHLANLRESLLIEIRAYAEQEETRSVEALATMAETRSRVVSGVLLTAALSLLGFFALSWVIGRSLSRGTARILQTADAMAQGDWQPALAWVSSRDGALERRRPPGLNEIEQLGHAFGVAAWHLERRERRLRAEGAAAHIASSSLDVATLASATLRVVVEHLAVEVAVAYQLDAEAQRLVPRAAHALSENTQSVAVGEGLPGQAAKELRTVSIRDIPPTSPFSIKLGYDEAPPRSVVATPVTAGNALHGVLLVASLRHLEEDEIGFLERAASLLGLGLSNAAAFERIQGLLGELREQYEIAQAQNEELQAQNEEIQAQNEEIQAQSEELQSQQEEIAARNDELERRTTELGAHAKRLEEVDERRSEFLGVLAHELRNPLAPIVNGLFLLKQAGSDSEAGRRALAAMERQTCHLRRLIDDLLDVTRIAQGKVHLEREPLELVRLIPACVEDQQPAIAAKNLVVHLDLEEGRGLVNGDRTRLSQVFGNLLSNAVKFTEPGGTIRVSLRTEARHLVLSVADTGIGIDPELMERLFAPFSQGATSLARTGGGLGLGLSLVKSLVTLHGGSVEAHSAGPGSGALFVVRLPLHDSGPQGTENAAEPDPAPASPAALSVLIVEDNVDTASTLRDALEIEGHRVEVAHTGRLGLEHAAASVPEVILCDLGLPELDGFEVARRLRENPRLGRTLFVAISGYASEDDRRRAESAGFHVHLAKPPSIESLREVFSKHFGAPRSK